MKKNYLIIILLLVVYGAFSQSKKPNIIIFISDDQNQIDLGCYGNEDVHTPNMDKLAVEGMRFTSVYAASPMCTPSRSNMFTGLYPFRNGSQMNHFAVRPGTKSLPDYLKPLGYRVVIAGKTHVSPESSFPFEHIGKKFGRYLPVEGRNDPEGVTVDFIEKHFGDRAEQPLCLIVAPWLPHVPWGTTRDFDPEKLKVPEYLVDTKATRQALAAYYQSISTTDEMLGEIMEAVENTGEAENTVFMYFSDQGTQFPGAKWTTYDMGLRVPFIVRWPQKVAQGSVTDALISLTDLTPTLVDLGGGQPINGLDGKSFQEVLLGKKKNHREYVFAETTVEPHYWYNYVPSRTVFTKEGFHYIRNYYPGTRFVTHIDKVEQNMFYFDTWVEKAKHDQKASFLLNRYSYRPPEELYDLKNDRWELRNLSDNPDFEKQHRRLKSLLATELSRQGEEKSMILQGTLPVFYDRSYEIPQGISAHHLSFNPARWNPDTLLVTAYLKAAGRQGVLLEYFNQFRIISKDKKIGIIFDEGQEFYSEALREPKGHMVFRLTGKGQFELSYNGHIILSGKAEGDHTKIRPGYVSCGLARGVELPAGQANYFDGKILNLRVSMNTLLRQPRK